MKTASLQIVQTRPLFIVRVSAGSIPQRIPRKILINPQRPLVRGERGEAVGLSEWVRGNYTV